MCVSAAVLVFIFDGSTHRAVMPIPSRVITHKKHIRAGSIVKMFLCGVKSTPHVDKKHFDIAIPYAFYFQTGDTRGCLGKALKGEVCVDRRTVGAEKRSGPVAARQASRLATSSALIKARALQKGGSLCFLHRKSAAANSAC